jgi:hypothetical protein
VDHLDLTAEAPDDVKYGIVHRSDPPRVGVRKDETAKDEKEVDIREGGSDERKGIEVVRDTEMEGSDANGGYTTPSIER